jgi:predicted Holliday junction resolvase-like endonuclease
MERKYVMKRGLQSLEIIIFIAIMLSLITVITFAVYKIKSSQGKHIKKNANIIEKYENETEKDIFS